jgi:hypothetical protein
MSRYERLSDKAKARVVAELAQEYALHNLRPVPHGTGATGGEQLELFSHIGKIGGVHVS